MTRGIGLANLHLSTLTNDQLRHAKPHGAAATNLQGDPVLCGLRLVELWGEIYLMLAHDANHFGDWNPSIPL